MKKHYLIIVFLAAFVSLFMGDIFSFRGGAPSGRAGSPIDTGTCNAAGCHNSTNLNSGPALASITTDVPATGWEPGLTYEVTVAIEETGVTRFGFEALAFGSSSMTGIGSINISDPTNTKLNPGNNQYVTHTLAGTNSTDAANWKFNWKAPAAGEGDVIFYSAAIASNANGSPAGDDVYSRTDTISENTSVSLDGFLSIQEANLYPTLATDRVYIDMVVTTATEINIQIVDMAGRVAYSLEDEAYQGKYQTSIDVNGWSKGMYLVTMKSQGVVGYKKFIVK